MKVQLSLVERTLNRMTRAQRKRSGSLLMRLAEEAAILREAFEEASAAGEKAGRQAAAADLTTRESVEKWLADGEPASGTLAYHAGAPMPSIPGGVQQTEWCQVCRAPKLQLGTDGYVHDGPCRCEPLCADTPAHPDGQEKALEALRTFTGCGAEECNCCRDDAALITLARRALEGGGQ